MNNFSKGRPRLLPTPTPQKSCINSESLFTPAIRIITYTTGHVGFLGTAENTHQSHPRSLPLDRARLHARVILKMLSDKNGVEKKGNIIF